MTQQPWMIEVSDASWRLVHRERGAIKVTDASEFDEDALVEQTEPIRTRLDESGYRGEPVLLALDSMLCLSATLPMDRPQQLRDRQAMLYQLEEWIPWEAERVAADYIGANGAALAVATMCDSLREFVEQLESHGIRVRSIAPTALLAAAEHSRLHPSSDRHVLVWQQDGWMDILRMDGPHAASWGWVPAELRSVRNELGRLAIETPGTLPVIAYDVTPESESWLAASSGVQATEQHNGLTRTDAAFRTAAEILAGASESPIELRNGALGAADRSFAIRKQLWAFKAAAAVLVAVIVFALAARGHRNATLASELADEEVRLFQQAFPNKRVPVGVRARLESELTQLRGVRGVAGDLPSMVHVLPVLDQLLGALPDDRRFRLLEIRIEDGQLYLDGEVREHSDAEAIAELLRAHGFEVPSPRTQRLDEKRVSFRITGQYVGAADPSAKGGAAL